MELCKNIVAISLYTVGQVVSISDNVFNEGQNSIELSVNYNNGQSYILLMSYEVNRLVVPGNSLHS